LAAYYGIDFLSSLPKERPEDPSEEIDPSDLWRELVVATDSKYVVDGITQWLPVWKANNHRTAVGKPPANLDLFLKLDRLITKLEQRKMTKVAFWHIDRSYNTVADALAKSAAQVAAEHVAEDASDLVARTEAMSLRG